MIIKNILNKVNIHFFYYFVACVAILTGMFKEFIIFSSIIIVHEMGHIVASICCRWNIERIIILPFGGLTIFKEHLNKPIKEELIILLSGPMFQIVFFFIYTSIFGINSIFNNYHYAILFFNLIPIFPLDGARLINLFLNKFISFKNSHIITVYISFVIFTLLLIFTIVNKMNLLYILILVFLLIKVIDEHKKHSFIFNKFLFERYIYNFNFKKRKVINGNKITMMARDCKHLFYFNKKYHLEKEILRKKFDFH